MKIKYLQEGGMMGESPEMQEQPTEQPTQGSQDPIVQLVEMAAGYLETQDPQLAQAVCEGLIALAQGGAPQEEPVMMRKGGRMCKKKKK